MRKSEFANELKRDKNAFGFCFRLFQIMNFWNDKPNQRAIFKTVLQALGILNFFYALSDELYCIATHIHEYIFF